MFRLIFALFLLDFSYRSSGVPIPTNASASFGNTLTVLAIRCENKFLSEQIKSKVSYCTDLSSPHGQKQLECMIYYDINKQLCEAVAESKLALTEDYSAKIKEEQDVNVLCGSTKDWIFSNLTENLHYKNTVEKIFKQPVTCGKVCGVEDLMSDDANFFCKYFQWGTNMLKSQSQIGVSSTQYSAPSESNNIDSKSLNPIPNDLFDVQIKNVTISKPNIPLEVPSVKTDIKAETSLENHQIIPVSAPSENSAKTVEAAAENPLPAVDKLDDKESAAKTDLEDTTQPKGSSQKSEVDKEIQQLNSELEKKEPVLDNPRDKPPSETDDYQESEEGKEGLGDIQGDDDGDDPVVEDVNKINKEEPKEEESQPPQNIKTLVSGFNGESVPGFLPSYSQEYADDNDDHFFSFFLTAVIMVVLIYVLYHNKNKVGKVFFGLILEGRQSGRRRNSRGHAYRRLDTLEQAMSTNTAAPPSKIIY